MGNYSDAHICQCLSRLATVRRNSPVTISGDRQKTGEQFVEGILGLARGLLELGLQTGDVVAICALNSDWFFEWLLAVTFVGGIAAPLNYRWSLKEARSAMEVARPVMLVTDGCSSYWYSKLERDTIPALKWHVFMNCPSDYNSEKFALTTSMLKKPPLRSLSFNYVLAPEDAAIICFTSGTTGQPKGVTISHSALIVQSLAKIAIVGYGEDDVYLHTVPLCHIGGISSAMAMLMAGGCHVLIPKFEANSALKAIEQFHVTSLITVPAIMADIVSLIRTKEMWKGKENVRKILNGGGGLSVKLIKDATMFFPRAKLLSAYETCSSLTFMTLYDPTSDNSSDSFHKASSIESNLVHRPEGTCVGKSAPHVELRIRLEDSSHVGRILTRGPHVMLGYWGKIPPEALNTVDEGWLDTGDIGWIDDYGHIWLVGRTKGRIKSGGENVYPEEVEAILLQHPGVSGIVVIGVPDTRLTEMVVGCVQIRDNWQWADLGSDHSAGEKDRILSSEVLQQFCRKKNLTRFKIPKFFVMWKKQFPLTTTGKLRRDEVRREVLSRMQFLPSNL